jgi:hypothetical protein
LEPKVLAIVGMNPGTFAAHKRVERDAKDGLKEKFPGPS